MNTTKPPGPFVDRDLYFPPSPTSPLSRQDTFDETSNRHWSGESIYTFDDSRTLLTQHGHPEVTKEQRFEQSAKSKGTPKHDGRLLTGQRANRHAPKEVVDMSAMAKKATKVQLSNDVLALLPTMVGRHQNPRPTLSPTFTNQAAPITAGARVKRHQTKAVLDLSKVGLFLADKISAKLNTSTYVFFGISTPNIH